VIHVKDFGTIYLATVKIEHEDYNRNGIPKCTTVTLEMLRTKMGCIATGDTAVGTAKTNGRTIP
jgi:hypothetical protein